jgi:tRNA nucleotidyltransferase (CCA-adding enzyme)
VNLKSLIKGRRMVIVSFKAPDVIPEILWSQLESLAKKIKEELHANEFETYRTEYWTDEKSKCEIAFEINTYDLGKYKRHKGPEIWDSEHTESFIAKNPQWWVQRSVIEAWKERKFVNIEDAIKSVLQTRELVPSHLQAVVWSHKIVRSDKAHKHEELMKKYFRVL